MRRLQLGTLSVLALALTACQTVTTVPDSRPAEASTSDPQSILDGSIIPQVTHTQEPRKVSPYAPAVEDLSTRGNYTAGGLYKPGVKDSIAGITVDAHLIPEPEVVDLPRSSVGNRPTYNVLGKEYRVLDDTRGFKEVGTASYYGKKFHGRLTSNREVYDMYAFSAAHKNLPLPSFARVTNLDNGQSVIVRVNDRGPFHDGRVIDLSLAAATKIGIVAKGTGRVSVEALQPAYADASRATQPAAVSNPAPVAQPAVAAATTPVTQQQYEFHPEAARFTMSRDGQKMTADQFDAWLKEQRITVATGKPRAVEAAPVAATSGAIVAQAAQDAPANAVATPAGEAKPVVFAPANAIPSPSPLSARPGEVILQVASFSSEANATNAMNKLLAAGIQGAMLQDGYSAAGARIWRLRVGPVAAQDSTGLIQQIARLGLGTPQRVM